MSIKVIVIGLGVQGKKRRKVAGDDFVASVDPLNPDATYRDIQDVPIDSFDAALVCLPDEPKISVLEYLIKHKKHVLVEKPLWAPEDSDIIRLQKLADENRVYCYTAYNHRFEPHFMKMKALIDSQQLGKIYRCNLFYGNGTAKLVKASPWRDQGAGVLPDLGSHLLDLCDYWFGLDKQNFHVVSSNAFENQAPDHVSIHSNASNPYLFLEMSLLSWRNHFTCDLYAENGTAHIRSLCKWGPTEFIVRERILPSGRPNETKETLINEDPTWALEYDHFKKSILQGMETNFSKDLWISETLRKLGEDAIAKEVSNV